MVLCLTHSGDYYTIDIVQQHLQRAGVPSFRLNSDEFGLRYRIAYTLRNGKPECCLTTSDQTIYASDISAVWYRKLWDLSIPEELDPAWHDTYTKEYHTYRQIFFNALAHVPWMNPMDTDHFVNNDKLHQLSVARAAGLSVPATLLTNHADSIRSFSEQYGHNLVMKLHGALSKSMSGQTPFFPTTRIGRDDLENLDLLSYCPMIFQEYIPKSYELRIAFVDGIFFAGKIPGAGVDKTDWRITPGGPLKWELYQLPAAIEQKLMKLMDDLGLLFGAIDMIRHPNGDYVFLEVNPQGEWGMLQKQLGYPIGETIAEKLMALIKT